MHRDLRYEVRLAKAKKGCTFRYIAEYLGIATSSIYCWLNNQFELSAVKERDLTDLLDVLLDRI